MIKTSLAAYIDLLLESVKRTIKQSVENPYSAVGRAFVKLEKIEFIYSGHLKPY